MTTASSNRSRILVYAAVTAAVFMSPLAVLAKGGADNVPTGPATYSIRPISADFAGATLNMAGAATVNNFPGKEDEQFVKFIWGDGQTDIVKMMTLPTYAKSSRMLTLSRWTKSHAYATPGLYTITVKIYHGNSYGAESYPTEMNSYTITTENTEAVCLDRTDNDRDGMVDVRDNDCAQYRSIENTAALCSDHIDNDLSGKADLMDPNCAQFLPQENTAAACSNGIDDDLDGKTDLADSDCIPFRPLENTPTTCTDGIDNDLDGLKDGNDPSCVGQVPAENTADVCLDAIDNDFDGRIDWQDIDCAPFIVFPECPVNTRPFFIPGVGFICAAGYGF